MWMMTWHPLSVRPWPLLTVELREPLLDPEDARARVFRSSAMPRAPHASDALVDGVSGALFVWLLHPPESFWQGGY